MRDLDSETVDGSAEREIVGARLYVLGDFLLFWLVLGAISGWLSQSSAELRTGLDATWIAGRLRT